MGLTVLTAINIATSEVEVGTMQSGGEGKWSFAIVYGAGHHHAGMPLISTESVFETKEEAEGKAQEIIDECKRYLEEECGGDPLAPAIEAGLAPEDANAVRQVVSSSQEGRGR